MIAAITNKGGHMQHRMKQPPKNRIAPKLVMVDLERDLRG